MKKFNTAKIKEILNSRFACGIGDNHEGFETYHPQVAIFDIARGPRTDHGGMDGEGWMCPTEIEEAAAPYRKRFKSVIELIILTCSNKGYKVIVEMDYGEKGHISLIVHAAPGTKTIKKSTKQIIKKMGVIETIRTAIFTERLTKPEILEILVATFPEREADKMQKTINAQLPSRIVKAGQKLETKQNAKDIKTYKLFTK